MIKRYLNAADAFDNDSKMINLKHFIEANNVCKESKKKVLNFIIWLKKDIALKKGDYRFSFRK